MIPRQVLNRRKADGGFPAPREPGNIAADHVALEFRRLAVGTVDDSRTQRQRPWRVRRRRTRLRGLRPCARQHAAGSSRAELQERPPAVIVCAGRTLHPSRTAPETGKHPIPPSRLSHYLLRPSMPKLCAAWRIALDADQRFSSSAIVEENSVFRLNRRLNRRWSVEGCPQCRYAAASFRRPLSMTSKLVNTKQ